MSTPAPDPTAPFFVVCGDTARNPGRSGIQTVVRSLLAAFGALGTPARLVVWRYPRHTAAYTIQRRLSALLGGTPPPKPADAGPATSPPHFHPLPPQWSLGLGAEALRDPPTGPLTFLRHPPAWLSLLLSRQAARVPLHRHPRYQHAPPGTWVLLPELVYSGSRADELVTYVHRRGWRLAAILFDAIPIEHPELVPPVLPGFHAAYMRALSRADLILPISESTAQSWRGFVAREKLPSPPVRVCTLACDLPGTPRVRETPLPPAPDRARAVRLLCVSTLEPRKNHRALFAAYDLAVARRPDLEISLDLVGAPYTGAQDLADAARALVERHGGRVRWHPRVEHAALQRFYAACDFTVYPSVVEGFGLPVIESLWFGRPCLCANFGVMAENAAGGGCLTADVRDSQALSDAILKLAADPALRHRLAREATTRPLKTWQQYAEDILAALKT